MNCKRPGRFKWITCISRRTGKGTGTYLIGAIANGVLLSRIDEDGNVLWRRPLLEPETVYGGMALLQLEDAGYLVAGLIQIINGRSYDAIILRTDAEGWFEE